MFWELYQQGQINSAKSDASRAESRANRAQSEISRVLDRIDSLAITCQAMWELIRERTTLTDSDIEAKMQEIDLRDGKADGKMRTPAYDCPDCGRTVSKRHARCLYCGAVFQKDHVFE